MRLNALLTAPTHLLGSGRLWRRWLLCLGVVLGLVLISGWLNTPARAQETSAPPSLKYQVGRVVAIEEERQLNQDDQTFYVQRIRVRLDQGGQEVTLEAGSEFQPLNRNQRLNVGTAVVVANQELVDGQAEYVLADIYRLPVLVWLGLGFFTLVLVISRRQGFFSILGMLGSLLILTYVMVPQILAGQNPVLVSLLGCLVVATVTVYLSHGFNRNSHISLAAMGLTLGAVSLLSFVVVQLAQLVGLGSEEAYYLQFGPASQVNLQGLLLAGIMLGALGVLDDITIAQVSLVNQLKQAKPEIDFWELYQRGLAVGRDHVASLVNTLILAYAGTSLPLFLLFTLNQTQPAWVVINGQMVAEEVVRTLAGSIGLVLAVPLTTLAASYFAIFRPQREVKGTVMAGHHHHHH